MASICKLEDIATIFAPFIEELHELFERRHAPFGSPREVAPFVERLAADNLFRDEMSSMVRAIIYRARDGLVRMELLELILVAVGGPHVDEAAEQIHEPVREMLGFVDGVFRSRWNAMKEISGEDEKTPEPTDVTPEPRREQHAGFASETAAAALVGPSAASGSEPTFRTTSAIGAAAAMTDRHPDEAEAMYSDRAEQVAPEPVAVMHTPLLHRGQRAPSPEREWRTRGAAPALPEVEPGTDVSLEALIEEERTPRRWFWTAGFCLLVLVFCAGLFVLQRAADTQLDVPSGEFAAPAPQPVASNLGVSPSSETTTAPAGETRAAASVGRTASVPRARNGEALAGSAGQTAGRRRLWRNAGQVRYTPTALFGVSPGVMNSHVLYAPQPEYPRVARLAHIEGQVSVEAVVARDGRVSQANVLSGHRLLRGAALHAVRERRYRPYLVNGKPTDVATILTVDFRLR